MKFRFLLTALVLTIMSFGLSFNSQAHEGKHRSSCCKKAHQEKIDGCDFCGTGWRARYHRDCNHRVKQHSCCDDNRYHQSWRSYRNHHHCAGECEKKSEKSDKE